MIGLWTLLLSIALFVSSGSIIRQSDEVVAPVGLVIYEHDYIPESNSKGTRITNNDGSDKTKTRIGNKLNNPIIERLNGMKGVNFDSNIQIEDGTNHNSKPNKKQYKSRKARANAQGKDTNPGDIRSIFY